MSLPDLSFEDRILERLRRGERAQRIGHGGARLSEALGKLLLGEVVRLHQELVGASGLDRVEVGSLKVLGEREFEAVGNLVAHDGRDGALPRQACGEHPAVTGNQLVAVSAPRYHYWLQAPVPPDGCRELREALRIERRPRLLAIGADPLERDLGRGWRNCDAGGDRALTKEHVEAAPEAAARHQAIAPRTARGARAFKRWESSRARALSAGVAGALGS